MLCGYPCPTLASCEDEANGQQYQAPLTAETYHAKSNFTCYREKKSALTRPQTLGTIPTIPSIAQKWQRGQLVDLTLRQILYIDSKHELRDRQMHPKVHYNSSGVTGRDKHKILYLNIYKPAVIHGSVSMQNSDAISNTIRAYPIRFGTYINTCNVETDILQRININFVISRYSTESDFSINVLQECVDRVIDAQGRINFLRMNPTPRS